MATIKNNRSIIFYDGNCHLCKVTMQIISKIDFNHSFQLQNLWIPTLRIKNLNLTTKKLSQELHLLTKNGQLLKGYESIRYIIRSLPILLPFRILLNLPGINFLGAKLYKKISTNRYKIIPCLNCKPN